MSSRTRASPCSRCEPLRSDPLGGSIPGAILPRRLTLPALDLPTALRIVAFAFVLVGFVGADGRRVGPVGADFSFSLHFLAGIGCAVASVSLAIHRRRPGAEPDGEESD